MPDEVESVTIRLASLELTISVRRLDSVPSSSLGFEVVSTVPESVTSSVLPTAPEEPVLIFDFEAGIEDRVIATQTARTLEQLPLPFLAYLVVKLRSGVEGWSPKARIARAFRAGVIAGRRLNGIVPREQPLNSSGIPTTFAFAGPQVVLDSGLATTQGIIKQWWGQTADFVIGAFRRGSPREQKLRHFWSGHVDHGHENFETAFFGKRHSPGKSGCRRQGTWHRPASATRRCHGRCFQCSGLWPCLCQARGLHGHHAVRRGGKVHHRGHGFGARDRSFVSCWSGGVRDYKRKEHGHIPVPAGGLSLGDGGALRGWQLSKEWRHERSPCPSICGHRYITSSWQGQFISTGKCVDRISHAGRGGAGLLDWRGARRTRGRRGAARGSTNRGSVTITGVGAAATNQGVGGSAQSGSLSSGATTSAARGFQQGSSTVWTSSSDIIPECPRLESTSTSCRPSTEDACLRDETSVSRGKHNSSREHLCRSGSRSRGGGSRESAAGTSRPDRCKRRSSAQADVCPVAAKSNLIAKIGSASPSRSSAVRVGRRIGQRRRQWIRSQRMHGEGCVRQIDERFESHSSGGGGECSQGTGPYTREGGHEFDEEVCRATRATSRESPAYLHHVPPHRCVVGGVFHRECGPDGSCVEDPGFRRADLPGLRPDAVILAANRPAGTTVPDFDVEPKTGRSTTVFPSCCSSVDLSESCIRQRFGYAGVESLSSGQRQQDQGGGSECRHRSIGQTKEAAKEPQGQTRKGQRRQGWRQQHRSRLGVCNSEEQFLNQHDSHRSSEASPHDRPAKSHKDKLPSYPHNTTDSYFPNLDSPSDEFNSIDLGEAIVKLFWSSHTGLKAFALSCMQETPCIVDERSHSLWPVPIPRWSWTGNSRLGPRRRNRRRYFHVRYRLLQIVIASLNWEVLGFVTSAPTRARIGSFISPAQHSIIERLERALDHFMHAPDFTGDELGRSFSKFQSIISVLKGLPKCHFSVENLYDCLVQVHDSLNHYSSHFGKTSHHSADDDQTHQCSFEHGPAVLQAQTSGAAAVQASRVKWENPPSFDPREFLNPLMKCAYEDPECLRLSPENWPPSRGAKMHCSKDEFLRLVERWDTLGACSLMKASDKDFDEAVGIFCVPKDSKHDRLIINPKTINSRMMSISESTKELAPGSMLGLLHLEPGMMYRFSADDLTDFYYTFQVGEKRATRNAFRMRFKSSELSHLQCYDSSLDGQDILVCLKTLAMGDSLAVEIAQQSHGNVLRHLCGALLEKETLRYRHPIPRSDTIEMLAVDDHICVQKLRIDEYEHHPRMRDTFIFEASQEAYKRVGLIQHEKKRKRNQTSGVLLGADFDGLSGIVMAPRNRIFFLSIFSLIVARQGTCTPNLLSVLTGCWIHVLLFRRALFSIMDQVFKEGKGRPSNEAFCLSRRARCELQLLAVLGPLAQSDLRASYSPNIYCADASPFGGAVIRAPIGRNASAELWRHTEQRGYYTRLQSPVSEILREKGYDPEADQLFTPEIVTPDPTSFSVPLPLSEGILFDCIELFRGCGNWSSAHAKLGLTVHVGVENSGRVIRVSDMADRSTFAELVALALRRVVLDWHGGMPCLSFGTLRRPQVRSKSFPAGFNPEEPFTAYHNMLARRACFVLTIALLSGSYISAEQPGSSRMFLLHCYQNLVRLGCVISHFAFCNFGSAFNKPSKWLHNKPWLIPLEGSCTCPFKKQHFVVQGTFTHSSIADFKHRCRPSCAAVFGREPSVGEAVSAFSAGYPFQLVQRMASGLVRAKQGQAGVISDEVRTRSLAEVGLSCEPSVSFPVENRAAFREWFEDPEWIRELCNSLPFTEVFRYRFRRGGHINVNETRVYKSLIKALAKSEPDSRFVGLLDSRVTIGAASKGRSSSACLTRILQGSIAYILGSNLYPGLLHCSSEDNRSDGPSRDRDLSPPSRELPKWLTDLQNHDHRLFDIVVQAANWPRALGRWVRLLLLIAGDIERNPGPYRGPMDVGVGFVKATADRMSKCFEAFVEWVGTFLEVPWASLEADYSALVLALRGYGLYLFEHGHPRYLLVYAITSCQEYFPGCRPYMQPAWQIDKKWQIHEPGVCRSVLPPMIVRAATALAILWGWNWAGILLLGFGALLHPSEMLNLHRRDLVFPKDMHYDSMSLYVRIRDPKTARFARRQHGRIDDSGIIAFTSAIFGNLQLDEKLYPASATSFRKQWDLVMDSLQVPRRQSQRGATPGVLRGSGATYLYSSSEDINWVAWRGRWARVRTLEYYLQEVASFMLVHELSPASRSIIQSLSDASSAVLWSVVLAEQDGRSG